MIRLTAIVSDHGCTYTLARDGVLILTTGDRNEAGVRMLEFGVEHPIQLVEAAEQWGVVEIHEERNADRHDA